MSLTTEDVKKIAHLARLNLSDADVSHYAKQLTNILQFIEQMNDADTQTVETLAHPMDLTQRLREDVVTEENKRDAYQAIAPRVEAGLYLVPKVLDGE